MPFHFLFFIRSITVLIRARAPRLSLLFRHHNRYIITTNASAFYPHTFGRTLSYI